MDEPNETTEAVEETPSPEAAETTAEESPPWGDDFDASRAWNTIQTLRGEVKESKQTAQEAKELRDAISIAQDPNHPQHREALEYLEFPYELEDDEDFDLEDDSDPNAERLSAVEQQLQSQQEAENLREFNAHLGDLAENAEIELSQRDQNYLLNASVEGGFTPEATEQAFKDWFEERKNHDKQVVERYLKTKQAPHVSKVGSSATELPDLDDRQKRIAHMTEQYLMGRE